MEFPIVITDIAAQRLIEARQLDDEIDESFAVRISCRNGGCAGFRHDLDFDDEVAERDLVQTLKTEKGELNIIIDPVSAQFMKGVILNYVSSEWAEGFKFEGGEFLGKSCACGESVSYCALEE